MDTKKAEKVSGLVFRPVCKDEEEQRCLYRSPTQRPKDGSAGGKSPQNYNPVGRTDFRSLEKTYGSFISGSVYICIAFGRIMPFGTVGG